MMILCLDTHRGVTNHRADKRQFGNLLHIALHRSALIPRFQPKHYISVSLSVSFLSGCPDAVNPESPSPHYRTIHFDVSGVELANSTLVKAEFRIFRAPNPQARAAEQRVEVYQVWTPLTAPRRPSVPGADLQGGMGGAACPQLSH